MKQWKYPRVGLLQLNIIKSCYSFLKCHLFVCFPAADLQECVCFLTFLLLRGHTRVWNPKLVMMRNRTNDDCVPNSDFLCDYFFRTERVIYEFSLLATGGSWSHIFLCGKMRPNSHIVRFLQGFTLGTKTFPRPVLLQEPHHWLRDGCRGSGCPWVCLLRVCRIVFFSFFHSCVQTLESFR